MQKLHLFLSLPINEHQLIFVMQFSEAKNPIFTARSTYPTKQLPSRLLFTFLQITETTPLEIMTLTFI